MCVFFFFYLAYLFAFAAVDNFDNTKNKTKKISFTENAKLN